MHNILRFQTVDILDEGFCHVLVASDTKDVLYIEPEITGYSEETEGQAGIIIMRHHDFVTSRFISGVSGLTYDVMAYGELDAIDRLYHRLENHSLTEAWEVCVNESDYRQNHWKSVSPNRAFSRMGNRKANKRTLARSLFLGER